MRHRSQVNILELSFGSNFLGDLERGGDCQGWPEVDPLVWGTRALVMFI